VSRRPGSKYGAVRTVYDGRSYASKAEATRAQVLDYLKVLGEIREWTPQPRFQLGVPENVYVADFEVLGADGTRWVEDVKGHETAKFRRDKKLWRAYGPCPLHVIRGGSREVIVPKERS
jgi:hypothetical protein